MIRFDGQGVDPVSVDSDSEQNEEPEEESDIGEIMSDNDTPMETNELTLDTWL